MGCVSAEGENRIEGNIQLVIRVFIENVDYFIPMMLPNTGMFLTNKKRRFI